MNFGKPRIAITAALFAASRGGPQLMLLNTRVK